MHQSPRVRAAGRHPEQSVFTQSLILGDREPRKSLSRVHTRGACSINTSRDSCAGEPRLDSQPGLSHRTPAASRAQSASPAPSGPLLKSSSGFPLRSAGRPGAGLVPRLRHLHRVALPPQGGVAGAPARGAQSILSTLPRMRPSYMGKTTSSSQTSSNTAPQANSSLAFLK